MLKRVVRRGGIDTSPIMDGIEVVRTLGPGKEGTVDINLAGYSSDGRIVISCKDAAGRYWMIDPITKATIRAESFVGGVEDWG